MKLRLLPEADVEIQAAAQWYEIRVAGLGERVLAEAVDALSEIEQHPRRFAQIRYRSKREIRRRFLVHFPYYFAYEVREDECVVVAFAHASRKPGFWRDRLGS
jgi:hypothetical protein